MKIIHVVPYNPDWPKMFETEAKIIKEALADNCIEIHHIGSTSVPEQSGAPGPIRTADRLVRSQLA